MVLGLLQLLMGLPELGQVEGGDLLRLLDLLLVGLDLGLQLASQVAHGHLVLLVLVVLELELLDLALGLLVTLQVVAGASLHVAQLDLQLPDARLQLGHGGLASLHGGLVGIGQTVLHVGHGGLKGPLVLGLDSNMVLLSTELISKASSIDHGLLGLLLRALGLVEHVVDLGLQSVDGALNPALVGGGTRVDVVHLVDGHASLGQLGFSLPLAPLGGVKEGTGLLHLALEGVGPALGKGSLLGHLLPEAGGLLEVHLGLPQLALVALDALEGLVVGLVGVVERDLELVDVSLELLLDPQGLGLGLLLGLQGSLHGLHGASVVLASVVELLLLLGDLAVDLLPHLAKLKLGPEHLVLLGLEGPLGLLEGALQLLLLGFHPPPLLVELVDGAAAIAELVEQILDLVSQVLVLTADDVQLLVGLVKGRLEAEPLVAVVASLGVRGVQLSHQVVSLRLPLADNLVEVLAALLGDAGSGVGPLVLHGQLLELRVHAGSRLLSRSNLGVQSLDVLLGLSDLGGQLVLRSLELVDAAKGLGLVLGLPQLDLRLGLAQGLEHVVLLLGLLVDLHPQVLRLRAESLELGEQGSTVASLTVGELLGVLQLGSQGDLVLLQSSDRVLSLLNLAGEVLGLNKQLLLGRVSIVEGTGQLVLLLVGLDNQALGHLAVLLHVGTLAHGLLESGPGLLEIPLHASLVLLGLGLVLVDAVNLVAELSHAVVVLLAESSQGAFVGNVGLIQVSLQLDQLGLALLVQLNLGAGVGANLSEPGAQILKVPGQQGTVLLGLGAVVPLHRQLLVELVNAGLQLLHLLGVLGAEGLLVLNLGGNGGDLLVLALHGLTELRVDTLEVSNSLLGELEVSLNLPLLLFDVALGLVLNLKSVLALIKGLLKLSLHLVEVVAPVLSGLDVLLSLLPTLSGGLLLLAKLDDHVLLVGNFIPESADLGVLGVLVLLALLNGRLEVFDLFSQPAVNR